MITSYVSTQNLMILNGDIGDVKYIASTTIPNGWMSCSGQAISRTTYAELFAKIGTAFGTGDGSTTFNLPDLRGEFIRGWDNSRGVDSGRTFGSSQTDSVGPHTHTVTGNNTAGLGSTNITIGEPAGGTLTATISASSGTETRPRNVALMPIIKVLNVRGYNPTLDGASATMLGTYVADDFMLASTYTNTFVNSVATSGYQKLPNGLIIMWGQKTGAVVSTSGSVTFPMTFPTACFMVTAGFTGYNGADGYVFRTATPTTSGFNYNWDTWSSNGNGNSCVINYIAIGN